ELLSESKRAHDALVRSSPTAICCLDRDGNVTRWNPAAERLFGRAAADSLGRPLAIFRPTERELFDATVRGALAGQSTAHIETKPQTEKGQPLDLTRSVSPLAGSDKSVEGALIILADQTERKRAERRLAFEQNLTRLLADPESNDPALGNVLPVLA